MDNQNIFLLMADKDKLLPEYKNCRLSTALEYFSVSGAAGEAIDAGKEPYLVVGTALEFGTHPFMAAYDCSTGLTQQGHVLIDTQRGTFAVDTDTLIAWM